MTIIEAVSFMWIRHWMWWIEFKGKEKHRLKVRKMKVLVKHIYVYRKGNFLEKYEVSTEFTENSDPERFYIFTCVEGQGIISYSNGTETIKKRGKCF